MRSVAGRAQISAGRLAQRILDALPFALTGAQAQAVAEIRADLAAPKRMIRLLQGDVGSGKTIVALLAMADVVEAGHQAALMAPTEILARQHFERIRPLAEAAGLRIALTTGRDKASERRQTLAALEAGEIDVVVGTHALFQESVAFRDLGLAVVDEQHRFGVHQRLALAGKGEAVDLLVMTATPIPRTLVLAYFGDMDVSALTEKPPGRQPIDTRALPIERLDEVVAGNRPRDRRRRARLLDLPAGRGERDARPRRGGGALRRPAQGLRRRGRPGPRPDEGAGEGRGDGALPARRDQGPHRHHRRRSRRRRRRGDDHGDRARRALRPGAIAPVARPGRARRRPLVLPAALQGPARRSGAGAASRSCARPRTASASPRRTCACAARAKCSASARPARRDFASPSWKSTASCWRWRAARRRRRWRPGEGLRGEANRGLRLLLYLFERDEAAKLMEAG